MDIVKEFDKTHVIIKLVLTFFFDWITGGLYRILKGRYIVGILWIITGGFFGIGWLIDFIHVLLYNQYRLLV